VVAFAELAGAGHAVLFHHDPVREDDELEAMLEASEERNPGSSVAVSIAAEERSYTLDRGKLEVAPLLIPV
jgi:hypothetical protein